MVVTQEIMRELTRVSDWPSMTPLEQAWQSAVNRVCVNEISATLTVFFNSLQSLGWKKYCSLYGLRHPSDHGAIWCYRGDGGIDYAAREYVNAELRWVMGTKE